MVKLGGGSFFVYRIPGSLTCQAIYTHDAQVINITNNKPRKEGSVAGRPTYGLQTGQASAFASKIVVVSSIYTNTGRGYTSK